MKPNLTKLLLTVGLGLGMLSYTSVAEARLSENSTGLTGQKTDKQPQQQLKEISGQGSSLTGQKTDKQPTQSAKGPETSP